MVSPFRLVAERLGEFGFFSFFLPWMITAAMFYGIIKKSKIFGDSIAISATLSLGFSFFIWGYLITAASLDLGSLMSTFVTQVAIIILVMLFGLLGASLFYPNLLDTLKTTFETNPVMIWISLIIILLLFFGTGLGGITGIQNLAKRGDVGIMILGLTIFIIVIITATVVSPQAVKGG